MQDLVRIYSKQRGIGDAKLLVVPLKNTLQSLCSLPEAEAQCQLVRDLYQSRKALVGPQEITP